MKFFQSNEGMVKPFFITLNDGKTAKPLTGLTIKWYFKARDDSAPAGSPITGVINGDPLNGLVDFTIPAGIFANKAKYRCNLNLNSGAGYEEDTQSFNVEVVERAKP
jgi:hypothetical protein